MISITKLRKRYPGAEEDALCELSLEIPSGEVIGLLGPNGAGKTTLIEILCGVEAPTSGVIRIDERVAVVPQALAFYPSLTVSENLAFYAAATPGASAENVQQAIAGARLRSHLRQPACRLSGGLKRRLNLAIGLLGSARILLMDEPTVGVDAQSRLFLLDTVRWLAEQGRTLVYTSHYLDEIEQVCDRVAILDQGSLLIDSPVKDISAAYGSLEAAYLKLTRRALRE